MRGKIFTIVVTRVDSALNHNVSLLKAVWDQISQNFRIDQIFLTQNEF
ncbi:hypothetical protein [Flavobacterium psychrophilum]|nr:hypothetical protein [Flavobacterium psychrophilum]